MNLLDRLRPRWRRSDPDERAEAVRAMGPHDQGRLASIASNDPEARVRRVAIKKLDDPSILDSLAERDADTSLREAAAERAAEIRVRIAVGDQAPAACAAALAGLKDDRSLAAVATGAAHAAVRQAALARVTGDRALRDVAKLTADPELAVAALARMTDTTILRNLALGDGSGHLALAAVERIADVDTLAAIANHRTASKAVRRRARELLPAGTEAQPTLETKAARARQIELGNVIQGLRAMSDVVRAAEKARAAESEWQALARTVEPKPDVAERFVPICRAIIDDADRLSRARAEVEHARAAGQHAVAARRALCERVEAAAGPDAMAEVAGAEDAWKQLPPLAGDQAAVLDRRFRAACTARRTAHEQQQQQEVQRTAAQRLLDDADRLLEWPGVGVLDRWRRLEAQWAALPLLQGRDPEFDALRRRFTRTAERFAERQQEAAAERQQQEQENLRSLEALLARVNAVLAAESCKLAVARGELQALDTALAETGALPPAERRHVWKERLTEARAQLRRRVTETEEVEGWRRWANADAQEAIIARAEGLLTSEDLADVTVQLKQLQDDWAACATTSPDRAQGLWERFRAARDTLRARSDTYLASNLALKRALVEQVANLGESTAWKETADLIKQLQAEWKEIGPVPMRQSQDVWRRFREPCDRFFARRKEHFARLDEDRRGNADRKTALCEQAEALKDSTDWEATAAALKALQAEWKRSGPPPRELADELWERFRGACDGFFDRFHRRDALEREDALRQASGLCEQVEALVASLGGASPPSAEDVRTQLDDAWGGWLRLDLGMADDTLAVQARLHAACTQIATTLPEALPGSRLDPATTNRRRERLCDRLDALVTAATATPAPQSLQEKVLALREQIASNTIAGGEAVGPTAGGTAREIERLRLSWAALGPVVDEAGRVLEARFAETLGRQPA